MGKGELFGMSLSVPSSEEIQTSIQERGFAPVPFEAGKLACAEVFDGLQDLVELCNMPGGDKFAEAFHYNINNLGNGAYYFNYRKPGEINPTEKDRAPGSDHKYVLHYSSQSKQHAEAALGKDMPNVAREAIDLFEEMYYTCRKAVLIGARALGLESLITTGDPQDDVILMRLLDYIASEEPFLGSAHYDRSVFTLAGSESSTGLRGVPGQNGYLEPVTEEYLVNLRGSMQRVTHTEYEAKFFLGAGANHLDEAHFEHVNGLPLFGHDIVNDYPGQDRKAVVAFANRHNKWPPYTVPDPSETGFDEIIEHIQAQEA